jgi:hypothetical protein
MQTNEIPETVEKDMYMFLTKKVLLSISALLLISGCASTPKSDFKETSAIPSAVASLPVWNFCREGAVSDQEGLKIYLDNSYVTTLYTNALFQSHIKIVGAQDAETIRIDALRSNNTEYPVFSYTRNKGDSKDVYITSESKTKSGFVIPTPWFTVGALKGDRKVQRVSNADFANFCKTTSSKVFIR